MDTFTFNFFFNDQFIEKKKLSAETLEEAQKDADLMLSGNDRVNRWENVPTHEIEVK